jgi:hypothetical protein
MTGEFCNKVYGSLLGMRIMRNALTAYAVCQHWGNAPEQFEPAAIPPSSSAPAGVAFLQTFTTAQTDSAIDTARKQALGLHTPAEMAAQAASTGQPFAVFHDQGDRVQIADGLQNAKSSWLDSKSFLYHYTIETPAYQLIITDTRTWRSFPRGNISAPDLIAKSQLPVQIGGTPDLAGRMLLVLCTTNFPPCPGIRQATRDLPKLGKSQIYENDLFDSWEVERVDYGRVLAELSRKFPQDTNGVRSGVLVVLSGDVHASSVSRLHYKTDVQQTGDLAGTPTKADLVIVQLVASALHNQSANTLGEHLQGYDYTPGILAKEAQQSVLLVEDFIGWNPVTTAIGTRVADLVLVHDPLDALTDPKVVPWVLKGDRTIVTLRYERILKRSAVYVVRHLDNVIKPPDFRLKLEYLMGVPLTKSGYVPPPVDKTDAMKRARDSSLLCHFFTQNAHCAQEIVGKNNIAEIAFTVDSSSTKQVHQTVRWFEINVRQSVTFNVPLSSPAAFAKYPGEP